MIYTHPLLEPTYTEPETEALPSLFLSRYLSQVWVKSHLSESNLSQNKTKKSVFAT